MILLFSAFFLPRSNSTPMSTLKIVSKVPPHTTCTPPFQQGTPVREIWGGGERRIIYAKPQVPVLVPDPVAGWDRRPHGRPVLALQRRGQDGTLGALGLAEGELPGCLGEAIPAAPV